MTRRLEVRLMHYFLMITMAAVMIGIEFYFGVDEADLLQGLSSTGEEAIAVKEGVSSALEQLRTKIVIMFGVLIIVVAIVMLMFLRNITRPLQKMYDSAKRINEGDLSLVVEIETEDEIGQVGNTINELTSNLQEVALMASVTCKDSLDTLEEIQQNAVERKQLNVTKLESVYHKLDSLKGFVDLFKLLEKESENGEPKTSI